MPSHVAYILRAFLPYPIEDVFNLVIMIELACIREMKCQG